MLCDACDISIQQFEILSNCIHGLYPYAIHLFGRTYWYHVHTTISYVCTSLYLIIKRIMQIRSNKCQLAIYIVDVETGNMRATHNA